MRVRLLLAALVVAGLGAACSSDDDGADVADRDETATSTADRDASDGAGADDAADDAELDCAALRAAAEGLGVDVQLMAQLRTAGQYTAIREGALTLDPGETLADIETLRVLEQIEVEGGLGTVEESLDLYQQAALFTKANLAVDDPFADAQGDELVALTQDIGGFLAAQSPISAAFDAAGCT